MCGGFQGRTPNFLQFKNHIVCPFVRLRHYDLPMQNILAAIAGFLAIVTSGRTSEGLSFVLPDDSVHSTVIDIARDGTFHLSRLGPSAR